MRKIVDKAIKTNFIGYQERATLLHIFHALGNEGARYIHYVIGHCLNYDYTATQKYIDNCGIVNPIGCKKLSERFEDSYGKSDCICNLKDSGMYPSPVVHAKRVTPSCFKPMTMNEKIGHIRQQPLKRSAEDILTKLVALNKQEYEINSQQKLCTGQLDSLFTRNEITEIPTPQGLLIKNDNGFFIKVG